jgi:hypothetical protein
VAICHIHDSPYIARVAVLSPWLWRVKWTGVRQSESKIIKWGTLTTFLHIHGLIMVEQFFNLYIEWLCADHFLSTRPYRKWTSHVVFITSTVIINTASFCQQHFFHDEETILKPISEILPSLWKLLNSMKNPPLIMSLINHWLTMHPNVPYFTTLVFTLSSARQILLFSGRALPVNGLSKWT